MVFGVDFVNHLKQTLPFHWLGTERTFTKTSSGVISRVRGFDEKNTTSILQSVLVTFDETQINKVIRTHPPKSNLTSQN